MLSTPTSSGSAASTASAVTTMNRLTTVQRIATIANSSQLCEYSGHGWMLPRRRTCKEMREFRQLRQRLGVGSLGGRERRR